MTTLSLYELNRMVHDVLALSFFDNVQITAEVSELRQGSNGHYYLELVEKDHQAGTFRAKARANLWHDTAVRVVPLFQKVTGIPLQAGLKLLLQVRVNFHEAYGYSLTVIDIDPDYTLGDLARRRQEILQRLQSDGVLRLNKELSLPRLLRRIAVVSAAGAAGYGDFSRQLAQSGFNFVTQLFEASMQGVQVENSILRALDRVADEAEAWDCVVIIRGGGAVSDLNGFDTYLLAAHVAQFPLPVFTGIGHERDDTIIDFVAHTRFKTPTAVAAFLVERLQSEATLLEELGNRIHAGVHRILLHTQRQFDALLHRHRNATDTFVYRQLHQLQKESHRLQLAFQQQEQREQHQLAQIHDRLCHSVEHLIRHHEHRIDKAAMTLDMSDPKHILAQGYSLTFTPDGKLLRSVTNIAHGQLLHTHFADGIVVSQAQSTTAQTHS